MTLENEMLNQRSVFPLCFQFVNRHRCLPSPPPLIQTSSQIKQHQVSLDRGMLFIWIYFYWYRTLSSVTLLLEFFKIDSIRNMWINITQILLWNQSSSNRLRELCQARPVVAYTAFYLVLHMSQNSAKMRRSKLITLTKGWFSLATES